MVCPKCNGKVTVKDTVNVGTDEIYRRRRCLACRLIFYTAEFLVEPDDNFENNWTKFYRKHKKQQEKRK